MRVPVTTTNAPVATPIPDAVATYLASPPISKTEVERMGGLIRYWTHELDGGTPLARMALDILTSPGMFCII
jgi:hypothetical protein